MLTYAASALLAGAAFYFAHRAEHELDMGKGFKWYVAARFATWAAFGMLLLHFIARHA